MNYKKLLKKVVFAVMIAAVSFTFTLKEYVSSSVYKGDFSSDKNIKEDIYTVGIYNGKIASFKNGSDTPIEVYDTFADQLPPEDRKLLQNGISAESYRELQKIIEDYIS